MLSLSGHIVYHLDVLTVLSCLLTVSQAYVNVALNKPAYIPNPISPGEDIYDASNAVDGLKSDLSWRGGQCAVSVGGQTATWWVNLTSIHSIHHITIYFLTNNKPWGPSNDVTQYYLGFWVYVSNTTDRLQGTLCYKDDNFTLDTIPAVFTTTCPVHGQYVIYYNERLRGVTYPDEYSSYYTASYLCEVEVYACDKGWYGLGCSETCGQCRDVDKCLNTNGTCLTGCNAGYMGHTCHTQCDRGSFGINCNETCGHCRDVNQCFHTNGTCLTGCIGYFQGNVCKTPCQRGFFGENCDKICVDTCNDCNDVTGLCEYGCLPGWTGYFCQLSCPFGFFGQNCTSKCNDTCLGCNNVNGVCDRGCHPGWRGHFCDRGERCGPWASCFSKCLLKSSRPSENHRAQTDCRQNRLIPCKKEIEDIGSKFEANQNFDTLLQTIDGISYIDGNGRGKMTHLSIWLYQIHYKS